MALVLAFAALLLAGCSAIVAGGDGDPIRCVMPQEGEPDPCLALGSDWRCVSEFCQQAGCVAESCNALDDDCDGTIDEDLDDDADGFTWCRSGPTTFDCDDTDANIHPTADGVPAPPDVCDGRDNDCDPDTPDGSTCPGDTICDVTACTGPECDVADRCVMIDCVNRPEICADDQFCERSMTAPPSCQPRVMSCLDPAYPCDAGHRCNPENGTCVEAHENGFHCTYDAECASNLCVPVAALRITNEDVVGAVGICSHACCDDGDCASTEVCWDSGSGARACVDPSLLARGPNGAPTASACLDSSACTSDAACTLQVDDAYRVDNRYSLACGAPPATPVSCRADWDCPTWYLDSNTFCSGGVCRNTPCGANSDCPSGVCIGRCTDPCRTADDCPTGGPFDATAPACEYAFVTSEGRKDVFPVCIYRSRSAARENGEACTTHAECRDDLCVDALGRTAPPEGTPKACAGACCNDAQCGAGQCRPIFVGTSWEMRCLPRRTFDQGGGGASSG